MLNLVSQSVNLPVSLSQAKEHLGITGSTGDDTRVTALIGAAVDYCERETNRAYRASTYDEKLSSFPSDKVKLELKKPPLGSVTSVSYYTTAGTTAVLSSTAYYVMSPTNQYGWIEPKDSWPATYDRPDAVTVRFVTAGTTDSTSPPVVSHAIKLLIGGWNENREAELAGTISSELKIGVDRLLNQLRLGSVY